jgi:hypothetical protein
MHYPLRIISGESHGMLDYRAVQDFTHLPIGYRIGDEILVSCPYCHRCAVKRFDGDDIRFVHAIRIVQKQGASKQLELDWCPKDSEKIRVK